MANPLSCVYVHCANGRFNQGLLVEQVLGANHRRPTRV